MILDNAFKVSNSPIKSKSIIHDENSLRSSLFSNFLQQTTITSCCGWMWSPLFSTNRAHAPLHLKWNPCTHHPLIIILNCCHFIILNTPPYQLSRLNFPNCTALPSHDDVATRGWMSLPNPTLKVDSGEEPKKIGKRTDNFRVYPAIRAFIYQNGPARHWQWKVNWR